MRVIRQHVWKGSYETELSTFVADKLDGSDYDRGQLEAAKATADNAARFLGRLVDVLAEKGILTEDDLSMLLSGADLKIVKEPRDV